LSTEISLSLAEV